MKAERIDFPCNVCGTPAKPDRIDGRCNTCGERTCASCTRRCGRCERIFCQEHVEERKVMVQQVEKRMLLCTLCRLIMMV